MSYYLSLLLILLVFVTGIISVFDIFYYTPKKLKDKKAVKPWWIDYSRGFFPIFLIVLVVRSFIVELFRIPSGSLTPTLLVGDLIAVNKYTYGLRLPLNYKKIVAGGEPNRGDIVVFRYPPEPSTYYIKRFVGVPNDNIEYKNKQLIINGKPATQKLLGYAMDGDGAGHVWKVEVREEDLLGVKHKIYIRPDILGQDFKVTVPKNSYFAMGDNRDDSLDSRMWGFVPEANIIGKAMAVLLSWNGEKSSVRWDRLGMRVH